MRVFATIGILVSLAFAGCIQMPDEPSATVDEQRDPATGGEMTATESKKEDVGLCTSGLGLGGDGGFCATRTITVDGRLSGFATIDVALDTFNGDVTVKDGSDGHWGFVATLKARGDSADAARAALNEIAFSWEHESPSGHFVDVEAKHEGDANNVEAAIVLSMPRSVAMVIVASTSNGDVELAGGRTDGLALSTSNGDIIARGDATQVSLSTSNGKIDGDLRPVSDGRWTLETSNGEIVLKVPEGPSYGYEMEGSTSNGEVDYSMSDGDEGPCPEGSEYYTPPCNERSFKTRGFSSRDIQVHATLSTSNGEINVGSS